MNQRHKDHMHASVKKVLSSHEIHAVGYPHDVDERKVVTNALISVRNIEEELKVVHFVAWSGCNPRFTKNTSSSSTILQPIKNHMTHASEERKGKGKARLTPKKSHQEMESRSTWLC